LFFVCVSVFVFSFVAIIPGYSTAAVTSTLILAPHRYSNPHSARCQSGPTSTEPSRSGGGPLCVAVSRLEFGVQKVKNQSGDRQRAVTGNGAERQAWSAGGRVRHHLRFGSESGFSPRFRSEALRRESWRRWDFPLAPTSSPAEPRRGARDGSRPLAGWQRLWMDIWPLFCPRRSPETARCDVRPPYCVCVCTGYMYLPSLPTPTSRLEVGS
jgi:hypothetical protein